MNFRDRLSVGTNGKASLSKRDPDDANGIADRTAAGARMDLLRDRLKDLQIRLYSERQRSVLVCLQGMDSAGKDGVIRHVFSAMNPMGCRVTSFKQPSTVEKAHDFLWRYHAALPERGWVGIFNRSHYESAVVERVQNLIDEKTCRERFEEINMFERMLTRNGTTILKFFLHISKDEQLARFKARLDDPLKRWKISESDYLQRELWDANMAAYEDALKHTSTAHAPWYIIPSNRKWYRDLAVGEIVTAAMDDMAISVPAPTVDIDDIRRRYHEAERKA
jgi:PPK2 family polyphosphate:nucleotide phosphotransferase